MSTVPSPAAGSPAAAVVNDFSLQVATANGSGSQTANNVLLRSIFRMGIPVSGKNLFPSNIQGLPTWFTIRASRHGYIGRKRELDVLVLMNPETAAEDALAAALLRFVLEGLAVRLTAGAEALGARFTPAGHARAILSLGGIAPGRVPEGAARRPREPPGLGPCPRCGGVRSARGGPPSRARGRCPRPGPPPPHASVGPPGSPPKPTAAVLCRPGGRGLWPRQPTAAAGLPITRPGLRLMTRVPPGGGRLRSAQSPDAPWRKSSTPARLSRVPAWPCRRVHRRGANSDVRPPPVRLRRPTSGPRFARRRRSARRESAGAERSSPLPPVRRCGLYLRRRVGAHPG